MTSTLLSRRVDALAPLRAPCGHTMVSRHEPSWVHGRPHGAPGGSKSTGVRLSVPSTCSVKLIDARAVARLLCAPRPSQAAISSSLLLIFSFRVWGHLGRGERGAEPSLHPFAWLERNTIALIIVSGVPPNVPPRRPRER